MRRLPYAHPPARHRLRGAARGVAEPRAAAGRGADAGGDRALRSAQPSCAPTVAAAEPAATPPVAAAAPPVAIDDIASRLAVIDRDLTDAAARLAAQRTAATAATAKARAAKADSEARTQAEVERTALDRVGNQISDIRDRLDAIAGTLAAASAGGGDITAPFATTGRLIARATALQADYTAAAAKLN